MNCITGYRKKGVTGSEIPVTLLFADVRGSTTIAEGMRPIEFRNFLDRFYRIGTDVILRHDGLVDKLVGDEVIGLFLVASADLDMRLPRSLPRSTWSRRPIEPTRRPKVRSPSVPVSTQARPTSA